MPWDDIGNGCHVTLLERNVGICLPSISFGSHSVGEDHSEIGRDHSISTVVAKMSLVTRPTGVEHGATLGKTASAGQVERIPSESTGAPASCLETIAKGVRSAGLSKDVAERVARGKL